MKTYLKSLLVVLVFGVTTALVNSIQADKEESTPETICETVLTVLDEAAPELGNLIIPKHT